MGQVELSIVIPAYNEEFFIQETLGALDDAVKDQNLPYEIVVVDDGSKDETFTEAMKYARRNGHVKVVRYSRNTGKGHAVKTGFSQTCGDVIIFTDSDMEIGLTSISKYVEALQNGDIAIGTKWHPDSIVSMPLIRRVLSHSFNVLVRILTGASLRDTQVGFKAMKRSAVDNIFPRLAVKRYAFDVELLAVAHLYGLKVVEMPVNMVLTASFKPREIWRMLVDLLGIAYRLRIIHWYNRELPTKNGLQNLAAFVLRET